jgi:hypothetical protein
VALLLPIALVVLAAFVGGASLRRRLQDGAPPRPSLSTRSWIVAGVAFSTLAVHLATFLPLRPNVPPNASAGTVLYGGPGDDGLRLQGG